MSNMDVIRAAVSGGPIEQDVVTEALHSVRTHLGMEIAYLSEIVGDDLVFRAMDAPGYEAVATVGTVMPVDSVYCRHIAEGRLPELIPDTSKEPLAMGLDITGTLPVGSHVSVPVARADGSVYGMFCCLSPTPNPNLNDRDLNVMRMFARLAQAEVQATLEARQDRDRIAAKIDRTISERAFEVVFQPIVCLDSLEIRGVESLSRFEGTPYRSPVEWFGDAATVDREVELEFAVITHALGHLPRLPETAYLSVNASPNCVCGPGFEALFDGRDLSRVVLEVTEHMEVPDFAHFDRTLQRLRRNGLRIAIDDAGAGYSGLQQMVRLSPDIIKLDRSLVDGIDQNRALRSLAAAMVHYAGETGAQLVAEGIERQAEADTLQSLGVGLGQGYLFGRPAPLGDPAN